MRVRPLQQKLFLFLLVSLLAVTLAFWITVMVSTNNHVRDQIQSNLLVGEKVFVQLLKDREQQLFSTANVLTNDFGFKRAVATKDQGTIISALVNHGDRIAADLMMVMSLDGSITASTEANLDDLVLPEDAIDQALRTGGKTDYLWQGEKLYQVIFIPVKAPKPIAIAVIGFQVNQALADNLKNITLLDISFFAIRNGRSVVITTLPQAGTQMGNMQRSIGSQPGNFFFDRADLVSRSILLGDSDQLTVKAYLSLSAREAFREFDRLQVQIFLISIVAIVVIILLGRIGAQKLSTPLRQLVGKAARIAEGDFHQPIKASDSIQELGELANAFTRMQEGLAEREEKILYQSSHDMMTGLFNRQHAIDVLDEQLEQEPDQPVLAIIINVRQFKIINESFGHQIGDLCLVEVAQRLYRYADQCIVARIGGDEFFVVMKRPVDVMNSLQRLEQDLSGQCQIDSLSISLRFSFGVADSEKDGHDASLLLERASIAQDRARREQDAFVFYDHTIEDEHKKRILLLNDLKGALNGQSEQLYVYYQPKVGFAQTREYRFEALLRWIHPEQGFVSPEYFIPLAEQAGLITRITDWVIEQVVKQVAEWKAQGVGASVAINLSAKDLSRPQILDMITGLLVQHQLEPGALSFEITESDIMNDTEAAIALLHRFRDQGFDVAIDDFGTGYSSLSQLKHMPVSELKIDKAFILNLDTSNDDQIIVRSTLMLAKQFNLKVVAEGVENQASLDLLQQWGCHWIQGFFLSKPLPAADIQHWIANKPASLANVG